MSHNKKLNRPNRVSLGFEIPATSLQGAPSCPKPGSGFIQAVYKSKIQLIFLFLPANVGRHYLYNNASLLLFSQRLFIFG